MTTALARLAIGMALTAPAAFTVFLAFHSGGYFPGITALVAAEALLLAGLWVVAARRPFARWSPGVLVVAAGLVLLWAWVQASGGWSSSPARVAPEANRIVLYLAILLLGASVAAGTGRTRALLYTFTAAVVVVSLAGLAARTLPTVVGHLAPIHPERLDYPLSYWNALGIVAGIGAILCGHFACSVSDPRFVRVSGAALVPLQAATVYYTFSRGATWASLVGVVVYVLVARPRAWPCAALATIPATLAALMTVNPANALTKDPLSEQAVAAGERIVLALALCALAAGAVRAVLLPLDARLAAFHLPARARRPVWATTLVLIATVTIGGAAAVDAPSVARAKWQEFERVDSLPGGGSSRLLSLSNNGRLDHWRVALDAFERQQLRGAGAGTYEGLWGRDRESNFTVRDAHSLYLETMGELGIVGLALVCLVLLTILGAFAWRARGPNRGLYGALLAAGVAWALHAGVDWDWEVPAVTLWLFALGGAALGRQDGAGESSEAERTRGRGRALLPAAGRLVVLGACVALAVGPVRLAVASSRLERGMDAIKAGDCANAIASARASLKALRQPAPYQLLTWCYLDSRPQAALAAMRTAVELDGADWELRYGLAVASAANGLDPRPQVAAAFALNPRQSVTQAAVKRFSVKGRRRWRAAARNAPLMLP